MDEKAMTAEIRFQGVAKKNKERVCAIESLGRFCNWLFVALLFPWLLLFSKEPFFTKQEWFAMDVPVLSLSFGQVAGAALLILAVGVIQAALNPRRNALVLDEGGLTIRRGFWRRRWSWRDLSDFRLQQVKTRPPLYPLATVLCFDNPGSDWRSRYLRWYFRLPSPRPAIVIENAYDTPIDEIADKLNAYRERALESATASPGPGAPA